MGFLARIRIFRKSGGQNLDTRWGKRRSGLGRKSLRSKHDQQEISHNS